MVCLEMWENDRITLWPKCHAGKKVHENELPSIPSAQQSHNHAQQLQLQNKYCTCVWDTDGTYYSRLNRLEFHVFLFSCIVECVSAPGSTRPANTQRWVVLLCRLATCLATVAGGVELGLVIILEFDALLGLNIISCLSVRLNSQVCTSVNYVKLFSLYWTWYITDQTLLCVGRVTRNGIALKAVKCCSIIFCQHLFQTFRKSVPFIKCTSKHTERRGEWFYQEVFFITRSACSLQNNVMLQSSINMVTSL